MAFITSLPLTRPSARRALSPRRRPLLTAQAEPIPPLNADQAKPMKEVFPLSAKAPICRCWHSANFPLCDGSHNAFNKATGSHVGPLVVSVAKPEPVAKPESVAKPE